MLLAFADYFCGTRPGGFKDLSTSRPKSHNAIFVLSGVFRHNDVESASLAEGALSPDAPPVHFYELFGQCQAQANARHSGHMRFLNLHETVKDLLQIIAADTRPVIFNIHPNLVTKV